MIDGALRLNHIYNMDCLAGLKEMASKSVDVAFTSPPYNRVRNDTYAHYDDTRSNYLEWLIEITNELLRVAKKKVIINLQMNHFNKVDICCYIGHFAKNMQGIIVWEKTNPQPHSAQFDDGTYSVTNAYEFFFVLGEDGTKFRANNRVKNVISSTVNATHFKGHGAVMKEEIADWFVQNFTSINDVIVDPFMGCGTTGVAAVKANRKYIGFEIAKQYCDIATDRIRAAEIEQIRLEV